MKLTRITFNPDVMGGKPCPRDLRVTVGAVVGLFAARHTETEVLRLHLYLELEDLRAALAYVLWRAEEVEGQSCCAALPQ